MMNNPWALAFGLLGNLLSLAVYLAPVPTFRRIYRKKTTEGFQSLPYVVALFSSLLWIYYALIKGNAHLIISINSVGVAIEMVYIIIFFIYTTKEGRTSTAIVTIGLDVLMFGVIVGLTMLLSKDSKQLINLVGWICVAISVAVYATPLSIIKLVVETRSVEFKPFLISFFPTLGAVAWLLHGVFGKDIYIMVPNILGIALGAVPMVLYMVYRNGKDQGGCWQMMTSRGHGEVHPVDQGKEGRKLPEACEIVVIAT